MTSILIVFAETLRLLSFLQIGFTNGKNKTRNLVITFLSNVISELLSRNNLYYKAMYWSFNKIGNLCKIKTLQKMENPALSRVYSIYFGAKYEIQYAPLIVVSIFNIANYGPSRQCTRVNTPNNIDVTSSDIGYWLLVIIFFMELTSDISSEIARYVMVRTGFIEKDDPRHRIILVILTYTEIVLVGFCASVWVDIALLGDCASEDGC